MRWSARILEKNLLCLVLEILCPNHAESHAVGDWLISGHRSCSDSARQISRPPLRVPAKTHSVVFILSKGVTANSDSVIPAPRPAITVLGPDILPNSSCSNVLYVSKATKPSDILVYMGYFFPDARLVRIPALREFPMIKVVHPAYHAFPNGGHPSLCPSGKRRLS